MNDLIERLADLDGTTIPPAQQTISADLARAHGARARRRRTRAALAGVGLTLALGGGMGAVIVSDPEAVEPAVALIAYKGQQPDGFTVAQVPEGFVAQGSDPFSFTIARESDTTHPLNFEDKLVVLLESGLAAPGQLEGDLVSVNGHPGAIRDSGDAMTLEFHTESHEVVVQMWDSVGLTTEQMVEFAEGISITPDVRREEPSDSSRHTTVKRKGDSWRVVVR